MLVVSNRSFQSLTTLQKACKNDGKDGRITFLFRLVGSATNNNNKATHNQPHFELRTQCWRVGYARRIFVLVLVFFPFHMRYAALRLPIWLEEYWLTSRWAHERRTLEMFRLNFEIKRMKQKNNEERDATHQPHHFHVIWFFLFLLVATALPTLVLHFFPHSFVTA